MKKEGEGKKEGRKEGREEGKKDGREGGRGASLVLYVLLHLKFIYEVLTPYNVEGN